MEEVERVAVVLYKQTDGHVRYAVLRRVKNWEGWELVKGRLEDLEPEDAVRKEVEEETGITDLEDIQPLDHDLTWTYERDGEERKAVCHCFLARAPSDARIDTSGNPDEEHSMGHFLNERDAADILHYDDQRELLEHAKQVLEERD